MKSNSKETFSYAPVSKQSKDPDFIRNQIGAAISSAIFVTKVILKFISELWRCWR